MRSELPWVWVVQNKHATPKGLLLTGNKLQQRFQRRRSRRLEPRVARFALQPWATRNNAFGVGDPSRDQVEFLSRMGHHRWGAPGTARSPDINARDALDTCGILASRA